jgi:hypothetical protein
MSSPVIVRFGLIVLLITSTGCAAPGPTEGVEATNTQTQIGESHGTDQKPNVTGLDSRLDQVAKSNNTAITARQLNIPHQNSMVKARIELQHNKKLPDQFIHNIESETETTVVAWVDVHNLTLLASHTNVTFIRPALRMQTYDTPA